MSTVTDFILTAKRGEEPDLSPIEKVFDYDQKFVNVTAHAGGGKVMQAEVWLASINHADHAAILLGLSKAEWSDRYGVTMLMKFEHSDGFEPVVVLGRLTSLGLRLLARVESDPAQWWNVRWA